MSEQPRPTSPTRERLGRPPRFIVLVVSAVVLVAVAWTAVWYFGTRRADELVSAWLAGEAAKGRTYECGERRLGGYPFRVEVTCASPRMEIADGGPRLAVAADRFRAVAQVWDLAHVLFEVDGPVRFEAGEAADAAGFAADADWALLRGSLRAPGGEVRRIDVAITEFTATPAPTRVWPGGPASISAQSVEVHGRHADSQPGTRDFDVALETRGLVVVPADGEPSQPVDLAFDGRFGALPYPPPRDPLAFLSAWRENGGSIDVGRLSAAQGETELRLTGRLAPDIGGQPEGTVTVLLAGPDVTTPGAAGAFGGLAPIIALALKLTGKPADIDGRTALSGEIELRNGQAFLGPVPIAALPRLF